MMSRLLSACFLLFLTFSTNVDAFVRLATTAPPSSPRLTRHGSAVSANDMNYAGASSVASEDISWDWQQVASSVFQEDARPVILFDGHCNLCNGGVNFALDHDPQGHFRFVSLQSKVGQSLLMQSGRRPDDLSSIVVCFEDKTALDESNAILYIANNLEGPLPVMATVGHVVPKALRDTLYQVVSQNRWKFGKSDACRMDYDGEFDNRFVPDP